MMVGVVGIAETSVGRGQEEGVVVVNEDHNLIGVLLIKLIEELGNASNGKMWVGDSQIYDVHQLIRSRHMISRSKFILFHGFFLHEQIILVQEFLPFITPALSLFVPVARTRLSILIMLPCYISLSIDF